MAIGAFGRSSSDESGQGTASASADAIATPLIDQGSRCEGKLSFRDAVRIDGSFSGEISSENTLVVGETGEIEASICSARVVVSGSVVGDVRASEQIVLHESARVEGNLSTPSLVMAPGAVLNGRIDMGPLAESGNPPSLTAIQGGVAGGPGALSEGSNSS
ncbi:MAG: polymer-forming cytoskeletal protein [Myxococcota bacterium]